MKSISKLLNEHQEIETVIKDISYHISLEIPEPAFRHLVRQQALFSLLSVHFAAEDWSLYPKLLTSDDADVVMLASRMVDEAGHLVDLVKAHQRRWALSAIEQEWFAYCNAMDTLLKAVMRRVEKENRELFPLAIKTGLVRAD